MYVLSLMSDSAVFFAIPNLTNLYRLDEDDPMTEKKIRIWTRFKPMKWNFCFSTNILATFPGYVSEASWRSRRQSIRNDRVERTTKLRA